MAQQSAEKALKAALVFLQIEFPWRHDLDALRNLLPPGWSISTSHPDLSELTEWAVEARYPSDLPDPTDEDARRAVAQAQGVWESVCADLAARGLSLLVAGGTEDGA